MQFVVSGIRVPGLSLIVTLLLPGLTAGILLAFQRVGQGVRPPLATLFEPLFPSRTMLRLVGLGAVLMILAVLVIGALVADSLESLDPVIIERLEQGDPSALVSVDPAQLIPLVMGVAIGMAVAGTLGYFAIPLVAFRKVGTWAALIVGLRGLARNWKPFLFMAGFIFATGIPVFMVAIWLLGLSAGESGLGSLFVVLAMLLVLSWQVYLFGCQWVAFADVFPPAEDDREVPDDQLVA